MGFVNIQTILKEYKCESRTSLRKLPMLFKHVLFLDWKAPHYQESPPVDTFATQAGSGKLLNCILCRFYITSLNSWAHSSSVAGNMHFWQWNVWGLYTHKRGLRIPSIAGGSRSHTDTCILKPAAGSKDKACLLTSLHESWNKLELNSTTAVFQLTQKTADTWKLL